MKIVFFGGTFDPVHIGHTGIAEHIVRSGVADRLFFLPAPKPPHKNDCELTPFELRVEMLRMALDGLPGTEVSTMEAERAERMEKSYTFDTLCELEQRYPDNQIAWLIGGDSLRQLYTWYRADELVRRFTFVTYPRYGEAIPTEDELEKHWSPEQVKKLLQNVLPRAPEFDISSTRIRELIASGELLQAGACLPPGILEFIKKNHLYGVQHD